MKRRKTFQLIPLSIAGTAALTKQSLSTEIPYTNPQPVKPEPLALRYTRKVREMLTWIRHTQSENLLEGAYAIARTVKNGGQCWTAWNMGHNISFDLFPERNGVPRIFRVGYDARKASKNDLFLSCTYRTQYGDLAEKGIFVIGSPAPWGGDAKFQELLRDDVKEFKLRPYSHIWVETNITTLGAVMHIPGRAAPFGPVSGILGMTTFWMMVADACRILARDGISVTVSDDEPVISGNDIPWINLQEPVMNDYFDRIMQQIEMIGAELGDIRTIAGLAADSALSGGKVWCYSRYRNSLAVEGQTRRGGLVLTRGLCEREGKLFPLDGSGTFKGSPKDFVIMGIWEPDDEVDLKNLDIFRNHGMKVASIGPMTRDIRIPGGRTVPGETDVHVGRMCDTYGLYAVPGFERKVCPTSGALINQIFWAACMEIAEEIVRRTGNTPGIFLSGALKGATEHNRFMVMQYNERGY